MKDALDRFFDITRLGSTIRIEVLAGFSTFLSLSYIFVVNPAILSEAGMDKSPVLFATILASALATLVMGLWARLPFALSTGLEMNAYVAFVAVQGLGFTWQEGLGLVFWSGVVFMILTLLRVRKSIITAIPVPMKSTLSLSVGFFLVLIAAKLSGVLTFDGLYVSGIGDLFSPTAIALYIGGALVFLFSAVKIRAAVLLSIIGSALYCNIVGATDLTPPAETGPHMLSAIGAVDLSVIARPAAISGIIILFLVDFYGSIAKFIGLTMQTSIVDQSTGQVPRTKQALSVDGVATMVGATLGTSSVTTFVESGVGIGAGGRTGLTAVTCSIFMLLCFFIVPLLAYVPVAATTGALVFVGIKLMPSRATFSAYDGFAKLAAIAMPAIVVFSFSLEKAMLAGFLIYIVRDMAQKRRPNPYVAASAAALAIGVALQAAN